MTSRKKTGVRAITMQQPYAAALSAGFCKYTRRGRATGFAEGGEWIAIHCGGNDEHLKNKKAMAAIRKAWPTCPSDAELKAQQRHILGFARFVGSTPASSSGPQDCAFMQNYQCSKPFCWEADAASPLSIPVSYPKGALQIWHLYDDSFASKAESGGNFRAKVPSSNLKSEEAATATASSSSSSSSPTPERPPAKVKEEERDEHGEEAPSPSAQKKKRRRRA